MGNMLEQRNFGTATSDQSLSSLFSTEWVGTRPAQPPLAPAIEEGAAVDDGQLLEARRVQAISRRLMELGAASFEDFGRPLDRASTQAALAFFRHCQRLKVPAFSAEPSGHVVATWRCERNVLTVRFENETTLQFTLAVEVEGSSGLRRTWGSAHRSELIRAGSEAALLLLH